MRARITPAPSRARATRATRATRAAATLALAATLAATLTACAQSPTTTYTNDAGEEVTLNWADYPASAWIDSDQVLQTTTVEEAPARAAAIIDAVRLALSAELEPDYGPLDWRPVGDAEDYARWYPMSGNGYGGDSMLQTVNAQPWQAEVTIAPADWERVVDTVAEAVAPFGLADRHLQDFDPSFDTWMRSEAFVTGDLEWLSISVQDATLDPEALSEAEEYGWLVASISFDYGLTTISDEDRATFSERAAPFRGLERPTQTHSD